MPHEYYTDDSYSTVYIKIMTYESEQIKRVNIQRQGNGGRKNIPDISRYPRSLLSAKIHMLS